MGEEREAGGEPGADGQRIPGGLQGRRCLTSYSP